MPWTVYAKEPDDALFDWLKSQYTTYRNALATPTDLPEEGKVLWGAPWAGLTPVSFDVMEDATTHFNRGLGVHNLDFQGQFFVRVTMRWTKAGKPTYIKAFREFLLKTLHAASLNLPTVLKTEAGIFEMIVLNSRTFLFPPDNAQADFWALEVRVQTQVQNSVV